MKNKLTLIKVGSENYKPTPEDLEKWKDVFEKAQSDPDFKIIASQAQADKEISVEEIDLEDDPTYVTLVKVNTDNVQTTIQDLEYWKQIFEAAQYDKNFKIFTHSEVNVEQVKIGKNTMIIAGNAIVVNNDVD